MFLFREFFILGFFCIFARENKNLGTMIQEYFYVSYGNYSGTAASKEEAKLMEEKFKLLEHGGKSLSSCGLETAKSADNDLINYL